MKPLASPSICQHLSLEELLWVGGCVSPSVSSTCVAVHSPRMTSHLTEPLKAPDSHETYVGIKIVKTLAINLLTSIDLS
ncbi:hypothetical protein E2C01_026670 [Portunus trituberculatus]|uniref:Uncharacterized protein n=1 Tax=Portunus trituberculatus TaxID=210409 RepID=A0A5B7EJF4_PORTR|nr:hypothetical protein [Portunus trituberculatus]